MNAMFRDNAVWSFFGLWYAPYLGSIPTTTPWWNFTIRGGATGGLHACRMTLDS
ncbi:MAG: hypothetical protein ACLT3Y_06840 [Ruminococcus callidus]